MSSAQEQSSTRQRKESRMKQGADGTFLIKQTDLRTDQAQGLYHMDAVDGQIALLEAAFHERTCAHAGIKGGRVSMQA